MNFFLYGRSVWGHKVNEIDVRALKRANLILKSLLKIGEIVSIILAVSMVLTIFVLVTNTNYEDVVLYDGTNDVCVFSGMTNEVTHVYAK